MPVNQKNEPHTYKQGNLGDRCECGLPMTDGVHIEPKKYHMSDYDIIKMYYKKVISMQNESKLSDEMREKIYNILADFALVVDDCHARGLEPDCDKEIVLITGLLATTQADVAQQCYLECLTIECGEGECARAILTQKEEAK